MLSVISYLKKFIKNQYQNCQIVNRYLFNFNYESLGFVL
jgi:hypothetical protein